MDETANDEIRFIGGLALTGALLAAEHWFPWWAKLPRLAAYTIGTLAIVLGQGVWLGFDQRWRRTAAFAGLGGLIVYGAWGYDALANKKAKAHAGVGDGLQDAD